LTFPIGFAVGRFADKTRLSRYDGFPPNPVMASGAKRAILTVRPPVANAASKRQIDAQ
jgi:hypothetical protein